MRRRQSLSKCVALCAFIITHLAPGAAAAPIGTPRFIELVHEQKDSNAPDFYCVVGDSGARLATAVRGVLNLAATDTVKIATDLSVYKLNQIFQTTRSRSLSQQEGRIAGLEASWVHGTTAMVWVVESQTGYWRDGEMHIVHEGSMQHEGDGNIFEMLKEAGREVVFAHDALGGVDHKIPAEAVAGAMIPRGLAHVVATHDTDAIFARAWVPTSPPKGGSINDASQIPVIDREKFLEAAKINIWILATVFTLATSTLYTAFKVATQRAGLSAGQYMKILADTFGTIVRHQFYPTCDFLQIFHSKVQLAIQGLPFEFRAPAVITTLAGRSTRSQALQDAVFDANSMINCLAGFHQNTPAEYQRYDDDRKHYHKIARLQK